MMHTKGKFKVLQTDSYTAVALPLDPAYIKVNYRTLFDFLCFSLISFLKSLNFVVFLVR